MMLEQIKETIERLDADKAIFMAIKDDKNSLRTIGELQLKHIITAILKLKSIAVGEIYAMNLKTKGFSNKAEITMELLSLIAMDLEEEKVPD